MPGDRIYYRCGVMGVAIDKKPVKTNSREVVTVVRTNFILCLQKHQLSNSSLIGIGPDCQ